MNIANGIERMGRRDPTKPAVVTDNGDHITYGQLDADANRIARLLRSRYGAKTGDRIGILAGNSIQFIQAFYGAIRAGAIAVPLNDDWTPPEINDCLDDCQPIVVLAKRDLRQDLAPLRPIMVVDETTSPQQPSPTIAGEPMLDGPSRNDPFYIGYTSGSTGRPKGVLRNHGSWLDSYLAASIEFQCRPEDRILAPGPLFFSLSLFAVTHALFLGSTAHVMSRFDPRRTLEIIAREKVTTVCAVPTLYEALINASRDRGQRQSDRCVEGRTSYEADRRRESELDLASVGTLICAGSAWPRAAEAKRELLGLFPAAGLHEYYGAAEMSFVAVSGPENQIERPRSVGKPFLGVGVEIRREDGTLAGTGEIGTLYAQSSFGFEGYYADPARTASVKQGDWMTVGDLAYADAQGYIYIAGRRDNVVITGGLNVSVEEVEAVLARHSNVAEVAVVGLHDQHRGQVLAAAVQKRDGADLTKRELRSYCGAQLASYKVPRRIQFVDSIPTTATGKVNRPEVARLFRESSALKQSNVHDRS